MEPFFQLTMFPERQCPPFWQEDLTISDMIAITIFQEERIHK
jgi:hypothetical protein